LGKDLSPIEAVIFDNGFTTTSKPIQLNKKPAPETGAGSQQIIV